MMMNQHQHEDDNGVPGVPQSVGGTMLAPRPQPPPPGLLKRGQAPSQSSLPIPHHEVPSFRRFQSLPIQQTLSRGPPPSSPVPLQHHHQQQGSFHSRTSATGSFRQNSPLPQHSPQTSSFRGANSFRSFHHQPSPHNSFRGGLQQPSPPGSFHSLQQQSPQNSFRGGLHQPSPPSSFRGLQNSFRSGLQHQQSLRSFRGLPGRPPRQMPASGFFRSSTRGSRFSAPEAPSVVSGITDVSPTNFLVQQQEVGHSPHPAPPVPHYDIPLNDNAEDFHDEQPMQHPLQQEQHDDYHNPNHDAPLEIITRKLCTTTNRYFDRAPPTINKPNNRRQSNSTKSSAKSKMKNPNDAQTVSATTISTNTTGTSNNTGSSSGSHPHGNAFLLHHNEHDHHDSSDDEDESHYSHGFDAAYEDTFRGGDFYNQHHHEEDNIYHYELRARKRRRCLLVLIFAALFLGGIGVLCFFVAKWARIDIDRPEFDDNGETTNDNQTALGNETSATNPTSLVSTNGQSAIAGNRGPPSMDQRGGSQAMSRTLPLPPTNFRQVCSRQNVVTFVPLGLLECEAACRRAECCYRDDMSTTCIPSEGETCQMYSPWCDFIYGPVAQEKETVDGDNQAVEVHRVFTDNESSFSFLKEAPLNLTSICEKSPEDCLDACYPGYCCFSSYIQILLDGDNATVAPDCFYNESICETYTPCLLGLLSQFQSSRGTTAARIDEVSSAADSNSTTPPGEDVVDLPGPSVRLQEWCRNEAQSQIFFVQCIANCADALCCADGTCLAANPQQCLGYGVTCARFIGIFGAPPLPLPIDGEVSIDLPPDDVGVRVTIPDAPGTLRRACSQNRGNLLDCFRQCQPAFCCSDTCIVDNFLTCVQYAPCQSLWDAANGTASLDSLGPTSSPGVIVIEDRTNSSSSSVDVITSPADRISEVCRASNLKNESEFLRCYRLCLPSQCCFAANSSESCLNDNINGCIQRLACQNLGSVMESPIGSISFLDSILMDFASNLPGFGSTNNDQGVSLPMTGSSTGVGGGSSSISISISVSLNETSIESFVNLTQVCSQRNNTEIYFDDGNNDKKNNTEFLVKCGFACLMSECCAIGACFFQSPQVCAIHTQQCQEQMAQQAVTDVNAVPLTPTEACNATTTTTTMSGDDSGDICLDTCLDGACCFTKDTLLSCSDDTNFCSYYEACNATLSPLLTANYTDIYQACVPLLISNDTRQECEDLCAPGACCFPDDDDDEHDESDDMDCPDLFCLAYEPCSILNKSDESLVVLPSLATAEVCSRPSSSSSKNDTMGMENDTVVDDSMTMTMKIGDYDGLCKDLCRPGACCFKDAAMDEMNIDCSDNVAFCSLFQHCGPTFDNLLPTTSDGLFKPPSNVSIVEESMMVDGMENGTVEDSMADDNTRSDAFFSELNSACSVDAIMLGASLATCVDLCQDGLCCFLNASTNNNSCADRTDFCSRYANCSIIASQEDDNSIDKEEEVQDSDLVTDGSSVVSSSNLAKVCSEEAVKLPGGRDKCLSRCGLAGVCCITSDNVETCGGKDVCASFLPCSILLSELGATTAGESTSTGMNLTQSSVVNLTESASMNSTEEPAMNAMNSTEVMNLTEEASVMDSTIESVMNSTEESVMNSTEESVMNSTEEAAMNSTEESAMNSTEESAMNSTEEAAMNSTEEAAMNSTEESAMNSTEEAAMNSTEEAATDLTKACSTESVATAAGRDKCLALCGSQGLCCTQSETVLACGGQDTCLPFASCSNLLNQNNTSSNTNDSITDSSSSSMEDGDNAMNRPTALESTCSKQAVATPIGFAQCVTLCQEARCCQFGPEEPSSCRDQIDFCSYFFPCINLLTVGGQSAAIPIAASDRTEEVDIALSEKEHQDVVDTPTGT